MKKTKVSRNIIAILSAMVLSFNLTACDPPMPPEVAAQILEQSYTCEQGDVTAVFPAEMSDPALQWIDSLQYACVDPLPIMTLTQTELGTGSDLFISSYPADGAICPANFTVPFAIEAAAVAFQLADSSSLQLSPKNLAAVLNGEITNWNDPKIAEDNLGTVFPDLPIQVRGSADELALASLTEWLSDLKQDISKSAIQAVKELAFEPLAEGEIVIAPNSQVLNAGAYSVSVITDTDKETGEQKLAAADNLSIASAASQLVPAKNGNQVSVKLDSSIKPEAQEGLNEAAQPYQAIYPVYLNACGEDTLLKHAVSLYLLRLDSQGVLAASNYNPLPERVRFESLDIARTGLPQPTELPEE
jgi:phosphate transport system substrate-binding protein